MTVPKFLPTAIGSLPHASADDAVAVILKCIPECPIWPQLPKRGLQEQMEIQYSENLPCVVLDREKGRMFFNTADEDFCANEMGAFYEKYMTAEECGDWSSFAISPEYSAGIPALIKVLQGRAKNPWIKVQTTGPVSFGLSIVDEQKRAIYYNDAFRDVIVKGMIAKCLWQIDTFKAYADNVICFIDEPILSAFGSSTYVSVDREDIVAILSEMVEAIHSKDALCGVHCCGNTEWPILIDAGVDIINLDAFGFGESIALYPQQVETHLQNGKYIAWGAVPTSEKISEQSVESLIKLYDDNVTRLAGKGIDKELIHRQSIITPSCGTGSLRVDPAEKVFDLLGKTARALQAR